MSENVKNLVPKLRFPEFLDTGKWTEDTFENFADFYKGKGVSKSDIVANGETPCIRYGELYTQYSETITTVVSKTNLPKTELFFSKNNDVIIPSSGETKWDIAKASCVMLDDVALGGDLNVIRTNQNGVFMSYYLNGAKKYEISKIAQGDSVVHLYSSQLKLLNLFLPPKLEEQQKIADCLSSVDDLITAQNQKVQALKQHKKGLMQQLFPAQGETVPKLRFPEFENDGEWAKWKLVEIANFRRGSFPQPYGLPEWYDEKNGVPFVQVFDVDENLRLKTKTKNKISKLGSEQSVFIPTGTLVVTLQGSIGRVAITQYDAYVDRTLLLFESFIKSVDIFFFAYVIQSLFEIEKEKAPGGIIKTITKEVLSDFEVLLPTFEEQRKIAHCLSSLDDLITTQTQQLEAYKTHKKGLMQQLFPSIDEV